MNTERDTQQQPLRIGEEDADRAVVFHPADDDLFVRTGRQVIEACRLGISVDVWLHEFRAMLQYVREWAQRHGEQVRACYASPRGASVGLFFVPHSESFNFDLADELAPLNRSLLKRFNVGMIEIHQVPERELNRFVPSDAARVVYRHEPSAHRPVET